MLILAHGTGRPQLGTTRRSATSVSKATFCTWTALRDKSVRATGAYGASVLLRLVELTLPPLVFELRFHREGLGERAESGSRRSPQMIIVPFSLAYRAARSI